MPTKTARCSSITLPCKCGLGPERLSGCGTAVVETAPSSVSGFRALGGRGLAPTLSLAGLVSAGDSDIQGCTFAGLWAAQTEWRRHARPLTSVAWAAQERPSPTSGQKGHQRAALARLRPARPPGGRQQAALILPVARERRLKSLVAAPRSDLPSWAPASRWSDPPLSDG